MMAFFMHRMCGIPREAGSRQRLCTGCVVFRERQEAGSGYAQDVWYSARGGKPAAKMHRKMSLAISRRVASSEADPPDSSFIK